MSEKSETVYPGIRGILKLSVLVNQKIFKTVYWNIKSRFFGQCWGISSTLKNCLFYISFDLKCRRAPTHIFSHLFGPKLSITSKNFWNCLQVCLGSETVCTEKYRQVAFYSPLQVIYPAVVTNCKSSFTWTWWASTPERSPQYRSSPRASCSPAQPQPVIKFGQKNYPTSFLSTTHTGSDEQKITEANYRMRMLHNEIRDGCSFSLLWLMIPQNQWQ